MRTDTARGLRRTCMGAVLAAILGAVAGPAAAVERGFYIAADYGKFRFDRDAAAWDTAVDDFYECYAPLLLDQTGVYACDPPGDMVISASRMGRKSRGYDLWVGYQLSPWFAVEGAYLDTRKSRHSFSGTMDLDAFTGTSDGPLPLEGRTSFRTRGAALAAVGNLELGDYFSLDARGGVFFADSKLHLSAVIDLPDGPARFPYSESDNKTVLFYGASVNFWVTAYVSIRGGFATWGKGFYDDGAVKQYFVGIRYSYGY